MIELATFQVDGFSQFKDLREARDGTCGARVGAVKNPAFQQAFCAFHSRHWDDPCRARSLLRLFHHSLDIPGLLTEKGARFNGTTSLDRTNYYETLPAGNENLEFAIKLEADRMINSYIRGSDLQSEFSVVRNEFERGENSPSRILMQRMTSAAFDWHNYGKSTIGARSDIENVSISRLKAFYRKYYQPDNAILLVAGKFNEIKTLNLIINKFSIFY